MRCQAWQGSWHWESYEKQVLTAPVATRTKFWFCSVKPFRSTLSILPEGEARPALQSESVASTWGDTKPGPHNSFQTLPSWHPMARGNNLLYIIRNRIIIQMGERNLFFLRVCFRGMRGIKQESSGDLVRHHRTESRGQHTWDVWGGKRNVRAGKRSHKGKVRDTKAAEFPGLCFLPGVGGSHLPFIAYLTLFQIVSHIQFLKEFFSPSQVPSVMLDAIEQWKMKNKHTNKL